MKIQGVIAVLFLSILIIFFLLRSDEGDISLKNKIGHYAIEAEFRSPYEMGAHRDLFIDVGGLELKITPKGYIYTSDGSLFFDLDVETRYAMRGLFLYKIGDDFIAFYEYGNEVEGEAAISRISPGTNQVVWKINGNFRQSVPVIIDHVAYLGGFGFVGKLNLDTGKYIWKFENLYDRVLFRYGRFGEPNFNKDSVSFTSIRESGALTDTIFIDDKEGRIIKMD